MIRSLTFLLAALLASPVLGEPFPISPSSDIVTAPYARAAGTAARNASDRFLAVWLDTRPHGDYSIRGSLFSREEVSDHDFEIVPAAEGLGVSVASVGNDFLVAYNQGTASVNEYDTHFALVDDEGRVELLNDVIHGRLLSITASYGHYFVATVADPELGPVSLTILDRSGRIVRGYLPLALRTAQNASQNAAQAALYTLRDGRLAVLWNASRAHQLHIALVSPWVLFQRTYMGLTPTTTIEELTSAAGFGEGEDVLLIAQQNALRTERFTSVALDKRGTVLHRDDMRGYSAVRGVTVVPFEDSFLAIADTVGFPVYGWYAGALSFTRDGRRNGEFIRLSMGTAYRGAPSFDGFPMLIATESFGRGGVMALPLGDPRAGQIWYHGYVRLAKSISTQEDAVVARCHGITTVAWNDRTGDSSRVFFRRFTDDGTPLDPPNQDVSALGGTHTNPTVTCGRKTTLLVWHEDVHPFATRMHGILLRGNEAPVDLGVVSRGFDGPDVVFDGSTYVVLARADRNQPVFVRWDENGQWLGERKLPELEDKVGYALAWNGEHFLLGYREGQGQFSLHAQLLDRFFNPIGVPVSLMDKGQTVQYVTEFSLAASPYGWLAGWERRNYPDCAMQTARLSRSGALIDPPGGVPLSKPQQCGSMQVGWNGAEYDILTSEAIYRRGVDGVLSTHEVPPPGTFMAAMTFERERRFLVTWRVDPLHKVRRLYGEH